MGVENTGDAKDVNTDATKDIDKDAEGTDDKGTDTDSKKEDNGLKSALEKERATRKALEKQIRDGELSKLPELERATAQVSELTKQLEQLTIENTRMKISMDLGLPWNLAKRATGDTEEEMRADAADLLKIFKRDEDEKSSKDKDKTTKPPANDGKKQGTNAGKRDMNALLRAAAGRNAS